MYSYEDRLKAVSLYIKYDLSVAATVRELGYPSRQMERALSKVDLLIINELSYLTFNRYQSEMLFQVISERSERASIIISTNLEFSKWTDHFENEILVAALIDRVTFRSHILNMNVKESYRLEQTSLDSAKAEKDDEKNLD